MRRLTENHRVLTAGSSYRFFTHIYIQVHGRRKAGAGQQEKVWLQGYLMAVLRHNARLGDIIALTNQKKG
jgi:hypothetical protein